MKSIYLPDIYLNLLRIFSPSRLRFTLGVSLLLSLFFTLASNTALPTWLFRVVGTALMTLLIFGIIEKWPIKLPNWIARWVLQLFSVAITIPISLFFIFLISTGAEEPAFWMEKKRFTGFKTLIFSGLLLAPWFALAALVRQKEATVQSQALAFELERSELERQALDARFRLLQSQIEPHFLFNTLANVRALVNIGSAQAPQLLDSLIAYLRASVPRLNDPMPSLEQELQLTRAYLELMHMRMPDRLQYTIHIKHNGIEEKCVYCPAMCLLSLVENAIRHGIDPSEEGGEIEITIVLNETRCTIIVVDTGVGIEKSSTSLGTGLNSLHERLQLLFQGNASLTLTSHLPQGTKAEIVFPLKTQPYDDS